jgi:hypothetical protein
VTHVVHPHQVRRIRIVLVRSYRYSGSSNSIGSSAWLISPSIEGGKSQGRGDGNRWPNLHKDVEDYVKGCATCQAVKTITHRNVPPITPIGPKEDTTPFATITVDFITKLPESRGCDTILTITDHDSTKAVILIPCREDMGSEEVARLFRDHAFPYTGIPKRIISDRDTRFTSRFFKELCTQLEIKQNMSSAYHPQTDGQSEPTNQTVETILQIFCNHQQDNWADWLKIALSPLLMRR